MYAHTNMCTKQAYSHACAHTRICTDMYTQGHACTHKDIHTNKHTNRYVHAYMSMHTRTHTGHACMHTHTLFFLSL